MTKPTLFSPAGFKALNNIKSDLLYGDKNHLDNSTEEEMIELLQLLFCQSLPVEACSVIEKLLSSAPDNDEYNTCMGDILEELGRYMVVGVA